MIGIKYQIQILLLVRGRRPEPMAKDGGVEEPEGAMAFLKL